MSSNAIPLLKLQVNYMYISVPASAKRKRLMPKKTEKIVFTENAPGKEIESDSKHNIRTGIYFSVIDTRHSLN